MMNTLKLAIGYILSFLTMTSIVVVGVFLLALAVMGSIGFDAWTLPAAPINLDWRQDFYSYWYVCWNVFCFL